MLGILCIFLSAAVYFDYTHRRIPNKLLLSMLVVEIVEQYLKTGLQGIVFCTIRIGMVVLFFYPLFKIGTIGAGDVKLFGICAGYFSWNKLLYFLFFSLLFAAIISVLKLLMQHNAKERLLYLWEYILDVIQKGKFSLYIDNRREELKNGVCMSGPILYSVLLYLGGGY